MAYIPAIPLASGGGTAAAAADTIVTSVMESAIAAAGKAAAAAIDTSVIESAAAAAVMAAAAATGIAAAIAGDEVRCEDAVAGKVVGLRFLQCKLHGVGFRSIASAGCRARAVAVTWRSVYGDVDLRSCCGSTRNVRPIRP